jgi:hypothetical protein
MDQVLREFKEATRLPAGAPPVKAGRGIVTTASFQYLPYLWFLIRSLRHHGCTLPVELWHRPGELSEALAGWLAPHGVRMRNTGPLPWIEASSHPRAVHGVKPYVVMHSAFREVLFLDADNSVFRDPTRLLDSDGFRCSGALFWPDMNRVANSAVLRSELGLSCGAAEFESGQMAIDTIRHWKALELTLHLNERCDFYYEYLYGDKETWRLAFDMAQASYAVLPGPQRAIDAESGDAFVHHDFEQRPLFYHRCEAKWVLGDVLRESGHVLPICDRAVSRQWLRELREAWNTVLTAEQRRWFWQRKWRLRRQRHHLRFVGRRWLGRLRRLLQRPQDLAGRGREAISHLRRSSVDADF